MKPSCINGTKCNKKVVNTQRRRNGTNEEQELRNKAEELISRWEQ